MTFHVPRAGSHLPRAGSRECRKFSSSAAKKLYERKHFWQRIRRKKTTAYHVFVPRLRFLRKMELQCALAALFKLRLCTGRAYVLRIYTAAQRDSVPFVIYVWPGFSWECYRSIYFRFAACVRNNIYDSFLVRIDQCHELKNIIILTSFSESKLWYSSTSDTDQFV